MARTNARSDRVVLDFLVLLHQGKRTNRKYLSKIMFDENNTIVQLCAQGMALEVTQPNEAKALFLAAWEQSATDFEKFTAAHYVARHQASVADKLQWDKTALEFALKINDDAMKANYPSLYLNIAKCYEDLGDMNNAEENYKTALSYENYLPGDGYGTMVKQGIRNGRMRIAEIANTK